MLRQLFNCDISANQIVGLSLLFQFKKFSLLLKLFSLSSYMSPIGFQTKKINHYRRITLFVVDKAKLQNTPRFHYRHKGKTLDLQLETNRKMIRFRHVPER